MRTAIRRRLPMKPVSERYLSWDISFTRESGNTIKNYIDIF
jgi:hypothetical protein